MNERKAAAAPRVRSRRSERGVTSVSDEARRAPKLPHERDESTDDTANGPRKRIRQAHDDLSRGAKDTDRGPVLDETYRRLKK
jgi:hypothetical protein